MDNLEEIHKFHCTVKISQKDATEGGGRAVRLVEVLSHGDTGGVLVWGGELGVVGTNGAEAGGSSCAVPVTGDKVEGKRAE